MPVMPWPNAQMRLTVLYMENVRMVCSSCRLFVVLQMDSSVDCVADASNAWLLAWKVLLLLLL